MHWSVRSSKATRTGVPSAYRFTTNITTSRYVLLLYIDTVSATERIGKQIGGKRAIGRFYAYVYKLEIAPRCAGYSPAQKVSFAEAELEAVLPRGGGHGSACVTLKTVSLDSIDAPSALAGLHRQATLLGVNREHGKLGLRQRA
ncbi:unnamed protein product [Lasius platythorax]|uniref:Uncharacterized protein n=1 Tax=Lasius platythorax TaxID=488582 RepID=A0AAV2P2R6_9HYME